MIAKDWCEECRPSISQWAPPWCARRRNQGLAIGACGTASHWPWAHWGPARHGHQSWQCQGKTALECQKLVKTGHCSNIMVCKCLQLQLHKLKGWEFESASIDQTQHSSQKLKCNLFRRSHPQKVKWNTTPKTSPSEVRMSDNWLTSESVTPVTTDWLQKWEWVTTDWPQHEWQLTKSHNFHQWIVTEDTAMDNTYQC